MESNNSMQEVNDITPESLLINGEVVRFWGGKYIMMIDYIGNQLYYNGICYPSLRACINAHIPPPFWETTPDIDEWNDCHVYRNKQAVRLIELLEI